MKTLNKINTQYKSELFNLDKISSNWKGFSTFALWLCDYISPKVVVDLGVGEGYSTSCFATSQNTDRVYGIDNFEGDSLSGFFTRDESYEKVSQTLQRLELHNAMILRGDFKKVYKRFNESIDILHIDGVHLYKDVKNDYKLWVNKLREGGVVLLHGIHSFPYDVGRFFDEITLPKLYLKDIHLRGFCNVKDVDESIKDSAYFLTGLGVVSKNIEVLSDIKEVFNKFLIKEKVNEKKD